MTKTTQVLTQPAPGTVVKPVHVYDEEQKEKLEALREVSLCNCSDVAYESLSVLLHTPPPPLSLGL